MRRGIGLFLLKTVFFVLAVLGLFEILYRRGVWPIISQSALYDHKMIRLQQEPVKKVKIMAMGSSLTLYELNSELIVHNFSLPYYNFGSWNLQVSDIYPILKELVNEYRPEYVIMCSSVGEFMKPTDSAFQNFTNTNRFIRRYFPEFFYFRDYHPLRQLFDRKENGYLIDIDPWGGTFFTMKTINQAKWNMRLEFPTPYTAIQYRTLDSLCGWLRGQQVKLIYVEAPMKASYITTPAEQATITAHFDTCRSMVEGHGGVYLNYHNTAIFADSLFFDQWHLQASGGVLLTKELVADLKTIIK